MKIQNVRTFVREAGARMYREIVQIDEKVGTMRIYLQEKKIGFPFSIYVTGLDEFGYASADAYLESMTKRERAVLKHVETMEVDTDAQTASEIEGLLNLAKHRKELGCYHCSVLKDGTRTNDIIEKLKLYGMTEAEAVHKIALAFGNE